MSTTLPFNKRHSEKFLQQHLQEITLLLKKQQLETRLLERNKAPQHQLSLTLLEKQHQSHLQAKLLALHPADIADLLETLSLEQRHIIWQQVRTQERRIILLEVSDIVRQSLMAKMGEGELTTLANELNTDEIADLAPDLPKQVMQKILQSLNDKKRQHLDFVLTYPEDKVGAQMDFAMITVRDDLTLKAVIAYIRQLGRLPSHTDKLFVVDQKNIIQGVLPLQYLLTQPESKRVMNVMNRDFARFQVNENAESAARAFERYDLISAPVVNEQHVLLGRLSVDTILDVIRAEADEDLLQQAGVEEEEDLFASVWDSAKNRWAWLLINITTAFIATRVIGLFEDVIIQIVALASLMPIIASTGGNVGNQTSMLIIRSLALGQLTSANTWQLIKKECLLASLNGIFIGSIVAIAVLGLYQDLRLAMVMMVAMFFNLIIAVLVGLSIPLLRHKYGKDPAIGTSVMLTFIVDAMGFLIFLGLANTFLL